MVVAHIDYSCFPLPLPRSRDIELPHKHTQTGQVGICGHPDTLRDTYFAHRHRPKTNIKYSKIYGYAGTTIIDAIIRPG